jgi:MFS family permease
MVPAMAVLRAALGNAGIKGVLVVWLAAALGSWAFTILLALYAYEEGGTGAVGIAAVVRLLPAAFAAPSIALLADRRPRRTVLGTSLVLRAAALAAIAAAVAADGPLAGVLVLAALFTVAGTAHKPAQAGLLTQLARTPTELAAANALWSTADYLAFLGGSVLAGALAATWGLDAAFAACAVPFVAGALVLMRLPRDRRPPPVAPPARRDVLEGVRTVLADRAMRLLTGIFGVSMLVQGMVDVLIVVTALELLDLGSGGPGWLSAAWALGGLTGGAAAMALIGRRRLGTGLIVGLLLAGLPLVAVGAWPGTANAVAGLVALGVGFGLMEVALLTLVQRLAPDDVLGRVFGVQETLHVVAAAIGSVIGAALAATAGIEIALVVAGLLLPAVALPAWRRRAALDARAEVPEAAFLLLRRVPLLAHLPISTVETLAVRGAWEEHPAGTDVVVQGETGERFFVVGEGRVQVIADGRRVAEQGPGGFFGEIALLRDAPRMATVRADTPLRLLTLDRVDFLAGIGSHVYTTIAADGIVAERLDEIELERQSSQRMPVG